MRKIPHPTIEYCRTHGAGYLGAFSIPGPCGDRPPNWKEMCFVKDLFWGEEECVIQYHPPESVYVKTHPAVLHLWRPTSESVPMPPLECV